MILNKQSFEDYTQYVESIRDEYARKEKEYTWKYKELYERLEDITFYYFTNKFETTKVAYLHTAKLITTTTIYSKDLEIINRLKEALI